MKTETFIEAVSIEIWSTHSNLHTLSLSLSVGDDKKTDAGPGAHFDPQFVSVFVL